MVRLGSRRWQAAAHVWAAGRGVSASTREVTRGEAAPPPSWWWCRDRWPRRCSDAGRARGGECRRRRLGTAGRPWWRRCRRGARWAAWCEGGTASRRRRLRGSGDAIAMRAAPRAGGLRDVCWQRSARVSHVASCGRGRLEDGAREGHARESQPVEEARGVRRRARLTNSPATEAPHAAHGLRRGSLRRPRLAPDAAPRSLPRTPLDLLGQPSHLAAPGASRRRRRRGSLPAPRDLVERLSQVAARPR